MAWMYMFICILDFAVFPVLWSALQAHFGGSVVTAWEPLTLKGAGLFHMAMGAVLGITAWSRGQEKICTINSATPRINTKLEPDDPPFRNTRND